jgi:hypothetical protein
MSSSGLDDPGTARSADEGIPGELPVFEPSGFGQARRNRAVTLTQNLLRGLALSEE